MSVRLFLGYFVALAACATLAFASFGEDPAPPSAFAAAPGCADQAYLALPAPPGWSHAHRHPTSPRPIELALSE